MRPRVGVATAAAMSHAVMVQLAASAVTPNSAWMSGTRGMTRFCRRAMEETATAIATRIEVDERDMSSFRSLEKR
jgi:hypothetical protein